SNDLRIFDYLPVPKVIFFLELDISEALIRMKNRDKGIPRSLSELNTDQLKTHLEIFKVNLELISQKCKALGTKVYKLNKEYNSKKVNEVIAGISDKVN